MKTADMIKLYGQIDEYRDDLDDPYADLDNEPQYMTGWRLAAVWLAGLLPGAALMGWLIYRGVMWVTG
jgi:hypothetical protein